MSFDDILSMVRLEKSCSTVEEGHESIDWRRRSTACSKDTIMEFVMRYKE